MPDLEWMTFVIQLQVIYLMVLELHRPKTYDICVY